MSHAPIKSLEKTLRRNVAHQAAGGSGPGPPNGLIRA